MHRIRGLLWGSALALTALAGCEHPPARVNTIWASEARGVMSRATPSGEAREVRAQVGEESQLLIDLSDEPALDEVTIDLEEGTYLLAEPVLLRARRVRLQGRGPHRTRLELDTESFGSLMLQGAERVELRGLTVVGYSGGAIRIKGCPDVVVDEVHFAGLRVGLELESSTAAVGTSIFAGCQEGLRAVDSEVAIETTAFARCWAGVTGRGQLSFTSCVFLGNRDAIKARLDRRSQVVGSVFAGEKQALAWGGRPRSAVHNLVHESELGKRVGGETNRSIVHIEEFPNSLRAGLPPGMELPPVHLTLERLRLRGAADPVRELNDLALDEALRHADACRLAALRKDLRTAREKARLAVGYLGDLPLSEAPDEVREIAALAAE